MTVSRRSAIKAIGVVGTGSALSGTVLGVNEHEDDERDPEEAADAEETGAIRVAHFSPDAPNVDVYVNDQRILADVAYADVSPYLEIVPGTYVLTITAAGDPETIVYEQQFAVETGYYTAAAVGELELEGEGEDEAEATGDAAAGSDEAAAEDDAAPADDTAAPDDESAAGDDGGDDQADAHGDDAQGDNEGDEADTAAEDETDDQETGTFDVLLLADRLPSEVEERVEGEDAGQVRVVHASPDAPNVDLFIADTPSTIFEDLEFTVPSGYVAVESGSASFDVFPAGEGPEKEGLDPEGEADDDETIEPDEDTDDSEDPEPVATFDLDVEAGQAYTAYAIGYLESDADRAESDGQQAESADEQSESADEQAESADEQSESTDEQSESTDERGDTAFEIVSLVDATTEDDDEMEDDADYDADDEVDEEPVDEGDDHAANDSATDDDIAANDSAADDDMAANDSADDVAADGGDAVGNESDAANETADDY